MKAKSIFGLFVAVMALVFVLPAVSAFATIDSVEVNGIEQYNGETAGVFAGDTIAVRTVFTAFEAEDDVRVIARILGEPGLSETTSEFDVFSGSTYSRLLNIALPYDLDDDPTQPYVLEVTIESNAEEGDFVKIFLEVQKENDLLEILSVESEDEVKAGETFALDVVVHNNGLDEADNTFVRATIPELGISKMVFIGDLAPFDQGGDEPDKEDSALGRLFLSIPSDAPAGVYNVEIEAFNADSTVIATRKVVVVGSGADSTVITSSTSKTFAAGEEGAYTVTIVNADNTIKVYELVLEAANGLTLSLDESVIAVPAGTSKTVRVTAVAAEEGTYNFAVNVHSDGELVNKQSFVASVTGESSSSNTTGNAAVVLTIILAIIFVVLLIVLIVLLTRKPEQKEDFGESYY